MTVNRLFLFALLLGSKLLFAQDIYDLPHSLRFAEYLEKSKQFEFAIQEYERILFMHPENDSIRWSVISMYRKAGRYGKCVERTEQLYAGKIVFPQPVAKEYASALILDGQYKKGLAFLKTDSSLPPEESSGLYISAELLSFDWKSAKNTLAHYDSLKSLASLKEGPLIEKCRPLIVKEEKAKYKKAYLAVGLSAIVPGLGKVYTKDYKDALIGFIIVGSSAFQSYRGFSKHGTGSAYGWVFGGIALGFYTGNIYGAYKAVQKYNHRLHDKLFHEVEDQFIHSL
jgi:hypothetical protein